MDIEMTSGLILLLTTVPIGAGLGWYTWRNRSMPGARPFFALVLLGTWWAIGAAVELLVSGFEAKLFWANLQYLSICLIPVGWLLMVLDYTGRLGWLVRRRVAALCAIPAVTLIILWTDPSHHLMRATAWLDTTGPYTVVGHTWGAWFWVHSAYSYSLLAIAVGLLVATLLSHPTLYRRQPLALLLGVAVPLVTNLQYVFTAGSAPAHDFTPGAFGVAGILCAWGLFRFRLFNLAPIARHALVENMQDGVLVLDQSDRVVDLNKSAQAFIGRTATELVGRPLAESWEAWSEVAASAIRGANQAEIRLGAGADWCRCEVKWSPLTRRGETVGRLVVLRDVTERTVLEESLRSQALTDSLTGLPNRALFMSRLNDTIRQARRHSDTLFAVMVLDLDRFKLVNDSLGHLAGDVLLQSVATKLKNCMREADTVARMGGDEFMILLHGISSAHDLLPVLDRIGEELRMPVYFRDQEMTAGSSVGVVIWDPSYDDAEDLVRAADTAMYQAKEAGRGCHRIFDEKMHRAVLQALKDETDLRAAIRERSFSLAYQPVIDMKTGRLLSLEALLRWHHPERGTVLSHDFIATAESSGLTVPMGKIALDEVCSQISRWQRPGHPAAGLPVSVNISPRQLTEPDFLAAVLRRLERWRIPSDLLIMEMTENALVHDPAKAKLVMRKLRSIGVRFSLDDFGAGWSSLQHLTTFPIQQLKIDTSYISKIHTDNTDLVVVRSLTALAHTLGLSVIAKGLERSEQWGLLAEAGCDGAQGYYIGSPMEPDALLDHLDDVEHMTRVRAETAQLRDEVPAVQLAADPDAANMPVWVEHAPVDR